MLFFSHHKWDMPKPTSIHCKHLILRCLTHCFFTQVIETLGKIHSDTQQIPNFFAKNEAQIAAPTSVGSGHWRTTVSAAHISTQSAYYVYPTDQLKKTPPENTAVSIPKSAASGIGLKKAKIDTTFHVRFFVDSGIYF